MAANGWEFSHLLAEANKLYSVIITTIEQAALPKQMPDGNLEPTLTMAQIEELAIRFGVDGKAIEIAALEIGVIPERYSRNFNTYGTREQIQLLKSKAVIVGLGGLGGTLTEWLARAGIGHLILIDGDRFEDHNLNRQLLCTQDRLGTSKARAAAERVCRINSSITVQSHAEYLVSENSARLVSEADVVVDCLDNIQSRFMLETAAKENRLPFVSAAVAGLSGHVTTIFPQDTGLELIYGPRKELKATKGAETTLGCLPQAVGFIAAAESAEVIKVCLGQTQGLLRHQMLMVDMATNTFEVLRLK